MAAAVVATVLTPVLLPGIPVLIAALVAVVVGWKNWFAPRRPPRRAGQPRTDAGGDPQGPGGELEGLP